MESQTRKTCTGQAIFLTRRNHVRGVSDVAVAKAFADLTLDNEGGWMVLSISRVRSAKALATATSDTPLT